MKAIFPISLTVHLLFSSCNKREETQKVVLTDSSITASASSNISFNSTLTNVVSHLETSGSHFSITNIGNENTEFAKVLETYLDITRPSFILSPKFNAVKFLNDLGLSKIDAMGRSSRANNDIWHNRLFLQTNGNRSGLLSVMGDEGSVWKSAEIAPADSDLVLEFELDLRRLRDTINSIKTSFDSAVDDRVSMAMQQKVAGSALTLGDMFGKTDFRATMIVSLDREKRWKLSEHFEMPTMHVAICVERGISLWKLLSEGIEKNAKIGERNGLKTVHFREEMETPMGKIRPMMVLDEAKDLIWLSMTEDYLEKCLSKKSSLSNSENFKLATAGFPENGNALAYVSVDFYQEFIQQMKQIDDYPHKDSQQTEVFDVVKRLFGLSNKNHIPAHGLAWCISNTQTGILCVGNTLFPDKGNGLITRIAPVTKLTVLSRLDILKQRSKVDRLRAIYNAKQLYLALMDYEADEGQFPAKLSDLVDAEIIADDALAELTSYTLNGKVHKLVYIPSLSTEMDSNLIILHSPAPIDGKYLIFRIDGVVKMVSEQEFEKLIKSQKSEE